MRKTNLLIFTVLPILLSSLFGCSTGTTSSTYSSHQSSSQSEYIFDFACEFNDFSLRVGESKKIDYNLTPIGTASRASYQIASGDDVIQIIDGYLYAIKEGSAKVKAHVESMENAKHPFAFDKEFSVNVSKPPKEEGNQLDNGGFEYELYKWDLIKDDEHKEYNTFLFGQTPHSGEAALNLWSRSDGKSEGDSDYLDLTVSQLFTADTSGTYLYSLWYKGDIDTITLSIIGEEETKEEFDATKAAKILCENQNGYSQFGIEVSLEAGETYFANFSVKAERTANWGFIDDVSVKLGTLEDLKRPENIGDDEHNFVDNPLVANDLNGIVNLGDEITRETTNGTFIGAYGVEGGSFEFYQEVNELPKLNYRSSIRVIASGEYTAVTSECYYYIADTEGNILFKQDFTLPKYEWTRIFINDVELEGSVRVGVKVVSSTRVWFGVTDFRVFSPGYIYNPSSDTSLTNIKVCNVPVTESLGKLSVILEDDVYETFLASKADCLGFVSGEVAKKAVIDMATFDSDNGILTITVKAEDGSKKEYLVDVIKRGDYVVWKDVSIPNPGFEESFTGWSANNLDTDSITSTEKPYEGSRSLSIYGKLLDTDSYGMIYQEVDGFKAGDKVKLSCYVSTYYNSQGAKSDVTDSIKLHIGNSSKEMSNVSATSSSYYLYSYIYTLTALDIVSGKIIIGLSFKQVSGKNIWLYADAFSLMKGE